jgi:proliferating cell nuclear antigen PCNA
MRLRTREGFNIKLLSEYMSNTIKFPPFTVNEKGLFLRATDQSSELLNDVVLEKDNFVIFKCPKPLHFIVNSAHLYRLLKTIKKKDSVTLFINEKHPLQLGICVEQNDKKSGKDTTYINITYNQPEEIELPDGYTDPIIVSNQEFQKLKKLHSIGNELIASVNGEKKSHIKFYANGKHLFSRKITLGENEDEDEEDDDEKDQATLIQTFNTHYITQLTKCAGQNSGNVQIYFDEELPMQIKIKIGTLGVLTVYIKCKELIECLETDEDNQETVQEPVKVAFEEEKSEEKPEEDEEDEEQA